MSRLTNFQKVSLLNCDITNCVYYISLYELLETRSRMEIKKKVLDVINIRRKISLVKNYFQQRSLLQKVREIRKMQCIFPLQYKIKQNKAAS